jgi:hypothetical protein
VRCQEGNRATHPNKSDMEGKCGHFDHPSCPFSRSGSLRRMGGPVPARLPTSDEDHPLERLVELLADRMVERLAPLLTSGAPGQPEGLVDAHEIARRTGRSRWWVYEHAGELGAIRLGHGPRARLGFSPARAEAYLKAAGDLRALASPPPRARPRRRRSTRTPIELLAFTRDDEANRPSALGRD